MRMSFKVVENGTILGFILSSCGSGYQSSELLWFLSVVVIFLGYWPVSFFLLFLLLPARPATAQLSTGERGQPEEKQMPTTGLVL